MGGGGLFGLFIGALPLFIGMGLCACCGGGGGGFCPYICCCGAPPNWFGGGCFGFMLLGFFLLLGSLALLALFAPFGCGLLQILHAVLITEFTNVHD